MSQLDRIEKNQERIISLLEMVVPAGTGTLDVDNEIAMVHARGLDPIQYLIDRAARASKTRKPQ